jgi:chromosome segregation ATPase
MRAKRHFKSQTQHEEVSSKLQAELAALSRFDEEVKGLDAAMGRIKEEITDAELNVKKTEHDIQTAQKEKANAENHVAALENKHPWILEEHRQVIPVYYVLQSDYPLGNLGNLVPCTTILVWILPNAKNKPKLWKNPKKR